MKPYKPTRNFWISFKSVFYKLICFFSRYLIDLSFEKLHGVQHIFYNKYMNLNYCSKCNLRIALIIFSIVHISYTVSNGQLSP